VEIDWNEGRVEFCPGVWNKVLEKGSKIAGKD
jgi:hypothetical protein